MPLPRVYRVIQDSLGNVVPQVLCSVLNEGTGVLATLWQDDAATIPLANPMTSDATYGSFGFYVAPGHYDLSFTKPGYTFQPQMDVQVPQDDLTLGTMAQQDANAVAITGGTLIADYLRVNNRAGTPVEALHLNIVSGASRFNIWAPGTADNYLRGRLGINQTSPACDLHVTGSARLDLLGINTALTTNTMLQIVGLAGYSGLHIRPANDSGPTAIFFNNAGGSSVGSITTNASATAYNTSSDARLKHAIAALTGALDAVEALRPVTFRWNADDSQGHGFLAHELQATIPEAVSGEPDAVNDDGSIRPQQVDHSRLVVWLVAAVQELASRVQSLETQLGL